MFFKKLQAGWERMMEYLHQQNDVTPEIIKHPEVEQFISETATVLNDAVDYGIREVQPSDITIQRLKESNYVFSGFKVFHELKETFPSLIDENGNRKPFEQFLRDVQSVHKTYNSQYLRAEYNFAVQSSLMASKWEQFQQDGDRYYLQYRTAGDERVRISHRMLEDITLPIDSPFWDKYYPPNGWGCRCTVVQVRKSKYPVSDEKQAMNAGSSATVGKHQEMFMFNAGKQMAAFPAYNPYTIKKCITCSKSGFKLAKIPDNELCAVCKVILAMKQAKESLKLQRAEIKAWAKENLVGKTVLVNKISNPIEFTMTGIKEALNQPHKQVRSKNESLRDIVNLLKKGTYVKEDFDEKENPMILKYHYVKIAVGKENSYAVIRELKDGRVQFYSIVEKIKEPRKT